jgi:hypothetical protein
MSDVHPEYTDYEYHRPWEEEHTFADVIGDLMLHLPYIIASVVLHFLIGLVVAGIMLLTSTDTEVPTLVAAPPPPPPDIEEEEEEEEPEIEEEIIEEPVIVESELEEVVEQETLEETGDPDFNSDSPFDSDQWNADVGLGGGAGGKMGGRGGRGGRGGKNPQEAAVLDALKWLHDHQAPSGFWDADEFFLYDVYDDKATSTGKGNPVNDVGLTGLSLLAFLGNGNTLSAGKYKDTVSSGIRWLRDVQREDGLFGDEVGNPTLYNHSIATMAMGEAYYFSKLAPTLKRPMKNAVKIIVNARDPYGAWRYKLESNGDQDTSITGWMVFALKTAEDCKIPVDHAAYEGAETWFGTIEDKNTGRVGYEWDAGPGSLPSRPAHYIDKFPAEKSESLTAVALLSRIFMTDTDEVKSWSDHPNYEMLNKHAKLLAAKLPKWDEEDGSIDMYYWYYGTFAMNQWGGSEWKAWKKAIENALIPTQRREDKEDNFYGSWDPAGPWGEEGGRVYSTATCALILEVYYRYARVLGAR